MTRKRHKIARLAPGVVLTVLVACAGPPPPAPPAAPPAPVSVDGSYDGLMQLVRGDATNCGDLRQFSLRVANKTFTYRLTQPRANWKPVIVFTARIGDDGSFNVRSGTGFMRGRVSGGNMHGEISGDVCGFSFEADHGGTW